MQSGFNALTRQNEGEGDGAEGKKETQGETGSDGETERCSRSLATVRGEDEWLLRGNEREGSAA